MINLIPQIVVEFWQDIQLRQSESGCVGMHSCHDPTQLIYSLTTHAFTDDNPGLPIEQDSHNSSIEVREFKAYG
jgi:hypothetical protein